MFKVANQLEKSALVAFEGRFLKGPTTNEQVGCKVRRTALADLTRQSFDARCKSVLFVA